MIIPGFYNSTDVKIQEEQRNNMLIAMQKMCAYTLEKNLTPTIEDFDDINSPIATAEGMLWFADRIPSLKFTFDTGNFMYSNQDEITAFSMLKDKIIHVHCKDCSLNFKPNCECKLTIANKEMYPAFVGDGIIKIKNIHTNLEKLNYNGIYTIEHFGAENQIDYMEYSAKYLLTKVLA